MEYQHIAGNEYQITLKIYTDNAFGTPADNPLFLSLYQESQNDYDLLNTIEVTPFVGTQISLTQDDCVTAPLFFDIIEFTYIANVELPDNNLDYHIVYQRCCIVNTLTNVINPEDIGITATVEITSAALQMNNSSPELIGSGLLYEVCGNESFDFTLEFADSNADSLAYSLCPVLSGGGTFGTAGNPGDPNACDGVMPNPGCPPPFDQIALILPTYNYEQPLGFDASYTISSPDINTVNFSGTPNNLGQFLSGFCVEEYVNGEVISTLHFNQVYYVDFAISTSTPARQALNIYPNPTDNQVFIELPDINHAFDLRIIDATGKVVAGQTGLSGSQFEQATKGWQGLYFVELKNEDQIYYSKLLVY